MNVLRHALRRASTASLPEYVLRVPSTRITTLPSGLRVASQPRHGDTATVGVWIDTGSRVESAANNGVAHFLEHVAFKGTARRTQTQLETEIENMGGHLNAYTSREMTAFYARVFKDDVPKAVDILSDILTASRFDDAAIEAERSVILREAQEVENDMQEAVLDHLHAAAFQGSPLARTILGPVENIKRISRTDILDYVRTNYTAPRMVVAAAGAVDHDALVKLSQAAFAALPTNSSSSSTSTSSNTSSSASSSSSLERARFVGSDVRVRNDDMHEAHVAIAFEGASWTNPDCVPLMVVQTMLGQWDRASGVGTNMASKLCQELVGQALVTSVSAFNTCYKDTGLFGVYAVGKPGTLDDMAYEVMHEMVRMAMKTTEEDVARARSQLKAALLTHLDDSSAVAEDIGRQLLTYGRRMSPAELFARVDAVDAKAVKEACMKYVYDQEVSLAAIGPIESLPDLNRMRRLTYMLRY